MTKSTFIKSQRRRKNNRISDVRRAVRRARLDTKEFDTNNNRKLTHRRKNGKIVSSRRPKPGQLKAKVA